MSPNPHSTFLHSLILFDLLLGREVGGVERQGGADTPGHVQGLLLPGTVLTPSGAEGLEYNIPYSVLRDRTGANLIQGKHLNPYTSSPAPT